MAKKSAEETENREDFLSAITEQMKNKMKNDKVVMVDLADTLRGKLAMSLKFLPNKRSSKEGVWRNFQKHLDVWEPTEKKIEIKAEKSVGANPKQRYKRYERGPGLGKSLVLDQRDCVGKRHPGCGKNLDVRDVEGVLAVFSRRRKKSFREEYGSPVEKPWSY